MAIWSKILDQIEEGQPCVLVTVFAFQGSAPRESGARMIVRSDGGYYGTIGGGALEWEAIAHARSELARFEPNGPEGDPKFHIRRFALGPELGQCCGGSVSVGFEIVDGTQKPMVARLADEQKRGAPFTTHGVINEMGNVDRKIVGDIVFGDGRENAFLDEAGDLVEQFGEWHRPLYLFGAGHVARALVLTLANHAFAIRWIDTRKDGFPTHFPQNTTPYCLENPVDVLDAAPQDAFVLIMTHSHALDEDIIATALAKEKFDYVGLIGSETKKSRFLKRLKGRGLTQSMIDKMVCPIGLSGIGSKTPASIGLSVAAQLSIRDEALRAAAQPVLPPGQESTV